MDNEPGGKIGEKISTNRTYAAIAFSDAVEMVADRYGFKLDIDPTETTDKNIIQKVGMTDYDFIRGLANITGYYFWVDGDRNGVWTLHFKHPATSKAELGQEKIYTFKYNWYDESSLLEFTPELLIQNSKTKIAVTVTDRMTGKNMFVEVEEENNKSPDLNATGDLVGKVEGQYTTASDIKLLIEDYSFEVISNRRFKIESEVVEWAQQWFKRMRDNFVLSRGKTIGCEFLSARQTHNIDGVGSAYNGEYFFSKVKHILNDEVGYVCDFGARRIVP